MKRRYVVLSLAAVMALALAVPAFGGPTNPLAAITGVKKTANKALKLAKAANKTAGAASSAAAAAQSTASGASTEAASASKAAKAAQTTANEGVTAAKAAQTAANNAQSTANSAKSDAAGAKSAADAAQATAESKLGSVAATTGETSGPNAATGVSIAICPTGSESTGGGFTVGGTNPNEVVPVYNGPYGDAWIASMSRIPGQTGTWEVTAYVMCASH
jgi:hypothetical protein